MATRNHIHECVVLRARESPAGDRILSLLSAEAGLIDVFLFGGPRSRLRSMASPYSEGRAFVYADPVKDFRKLSDFDVSRANPGLRENLDRLWSAGLVAEILLKTSGGGGEFAHMRELAATTFARLSEAVPGATEYPLLVFLWRLLSVLGLRPDPATCSACGAPTFPVSPPGASVFFSLYSAAEDGFLCSSCARRGERRADDEASWQGGVIPVTAGALRWLTRSDELSFDRAMAIRLDRESLSGLRDLLFFLATGAAGSPLNSLGEAMRGTISGL